ncbi:hypothetical protein AAFN46_13385 [Pseudomonas sp. CAU 1711]|uniref:hypothetical protein n=1 Tax=Pseudomonas sp. CAU 1711 TaxID=3140356 RepID=UPI003261829E
MNLSKLEKFTPAQEQDLECDLFIVCNCLEARATNVLRSLRVVAGNVLIVRSDGIDDISDLPVSCKNVVKVDDSERVSDILLDLISKQGAEVKVVLDISCMSRTLMANIFSVMAFDSPNSRVELITLYSLAEFTFPVENRLANESIEPVHGRLAGWATPETKPTSLILGLGYEPDKAEGASEYFEPCDQWVFIPRSPIPEFLEQVNKNNHNLISKTEETRLIEYDVDDPEFTYGQLELVISALTKHSNPVLLPFGPKIFFFLCLFQCLNHPELGVWRVTGRGDSNSAEITASKYIMGFRCILDAAPS